jgi:hypothetical protein
LAGRYKARENPQQAFNVGNPDRTRGHQAGAQPLSQACEAMEALPPARTPRDADEKAHDRAVNKASRIAEQIVSAPALMRTLVSSFQVASQKPRTGLWAKISCNKAAMRKTLSDDLYHRLDRTSIAAFSCATPSRRE